MEHKIDRIITKIDKIEETLVKQEINLARLTTSVEDHVRRTNILEEEIKPIKIHVNMVQGALKLITILGVLAAIAEVVVLWIKH